jgi:hypothetical protein
MELKSKESSAIQDTFDTHLIVEQYEVKPIEGIKPPNVEFECIDLVDEIKDMKEVLINFARYNHKTKLIKTSEEQQIFIGHSPCTPEERKNGLGIFHASKYIN